MARALEQAIVSQPQRVGHRLKAGGLGGEVLGGGECSRRVAVARLALDGDFERFAEQAEHDRVFADVVADSQLVIGDFVVRPLTCAAFAAVVRLAHLSRNAGYANAVGTPVRLRLRSK